MRFIVCAQKLALHANDKSLKSQCKIRRKSTKLYPGKTTAEQIFIMQLRGSQKRYLIVVLEHAFRQSYF